MKAKAGDTVDAYAAKLASPHREIVEALRGFVREAAPDLREAIKWGNPTWLRKGNVCWIISYRDHVDFGFFQGTSLKDPKGLLEGTGKGLRHVKLYSVKDIRPADLKALLEQAVAMDAG